MNNQTLLETFAADQRRRYLRSGTVDRRHRTLNRFSRWIEPTLLTEATPGDLEQWLDIDCKLTGPSRYGYISTLHSFYEWARNLGLVDGDPTDKLVRPRLPRRLPRPMPIHQLRHAIETADERMRCWLFLAGFQGLRCFEIAGLRRDDIRDQSDPPVLFVADGKGGDQRQMPLHPATVEALQPFLARRGWLFVQAHGKRRGDRYPAGTVSSYIGRHCHRAGIADTAHNARHLFATMVYRISKDLRLTQELLGHADPKTTTIYTLLDPAAAGDVLARLTLGPAITPTPTPASSGPTIRANRRHSTGGESR